jgi:Tfp pilus assembly protein PilF
MTEPRSQTPQARRDVARIFRAAARTFRLRQGYGGLPKRISAKAVTVRGVIIAIALVVGACAAKAPPALPTVLKYGDFMYPAVPPELRAPAEAERIDRGWRFLQNDDLAAADREYAAALQRSPAFYPALAGKGYVALAREQYEDAVASMRR